MASESIDVALYMRAPMTDVPTVYSLGTALLAAVPDGKSRTDLVRQAAKELREAVVFLRDAWRASLKYGPGDRRAFDVVADASWRSLYYALYALTLRAGNGHADDEAVAKIAQELIARVFPNRLDFTQFAYTSQWAHADALLSDIDAAPAPGDSLKKPLAEVIDELVGEGFLAFIRRAHASYGDALTITAAATEAPGGVREPKRRVDVAIVNYVIALFASHRPNSSAETNALLRRALRPIDDVRAAQTSAPARPATPPDPVEPPAPGPVGPPPDEPIPAIE